MGHSLGACLSLLRRIAGRTRGIGSRDAVALSFATMLGQSVQFFGVFVLTRLYIPSEFGVFFAFLAINVVLLPIVSLRYEWAIPIAASDNEAFDLLGLSLTLSVAGGLFVGVSLNGLFVLLRPGAFDAGYAGWIMPMALIFIGLSNSANVWFVRRNAIVTLSRIRFTLLAAPVLGQIIFGMVLGGLDGLMWGYVLGHALTALLSVSSCWNDVKHALRQWSASRTAAAARTYRRFAMFSCPADIIRAINMQLPSMLIPALFGTAVGGTYALAQRVVWQPVYLINYSIQTVFWAGAARAMREDPASLRPHFLKTSATLAFLLIPAIIVAPFVPRFFALCFGEDWRNAGDFAGVLLIPAITYIIACSTNCLHVCGYNKWQIFIEGGQLFVSVGLLAAARTLALDPLLTVCCIAVTAVLAHLALWTSNAIVLRPGHADNRFVGVEARRVSESTISP